MKKLIAVMIIFCVTFGIMRYLRHSGNNEETGLVSVDSGMVLMMGTYARVKAVATDEATAERAVEAAFSALNEVNQRLSTYIEDSELATVNRKAAVEEVAVSEETYKLLERAVEFYEMTEGAFDITVGPLVHLWKETGQKNELPSEKKVKETLIKVGSDKLILNSENGFKVRFAVEGMEIKVDAIAKGYAVDEALAAVRQVGAAGGLVDIGGEIAVFGQPEKRDIWKLGIQNPFAVSDEELNTSVAWKLAISEGSVATSGNYRQFVEIAGRHFSHIIDPRTGRPTDAMPSVTVIATNTQDADALATALSVMTAEDGLKLVESMDSVEAFMIGGTADKPEYHKSSGFDLYIVR